MALVVLLRGVNVGTARRFRPTELAVRLKHLGVVNIGAAGTLVVRAPASRARVRAELKKHLPFETDILICDGRDILRLASRELAPIPAGVVRFVSVLSRVPRTPVALPLQLPRTGPWLVKVVAVEGRYVLGQYRRDMKTIGHLGALDRMFGGRVTTRNWNTVASISKALRALE